MAKKPTKGMPGYYSPSEAMKRFGLINRDLFNSIIRKHEKSGRLKPIKPAGVRMYPVAQIDALADEMALILLQAFADEELDPTEFRVATEHDAQGIVNVLTSLGWKTTSAELRKSWYQVNPEIDHVVTQNGIVIGYVNMVPYIPEVLEDMMIGRKRGWDIKPSDILPYEPGHTYDVFTGLAERNDTPHRAICGRRLILGLRDVLKNWVGRNILIHRMYATSSEEDGIKLCNALGFEQQEPRPGDRFGRFILDLRTSNHLFARQYREAIKWIKE